MTAPTSFEQFIGVVDAMTTVALTGMLVTIAGEHLPNALLDGWSIRDSHGLIPGLIEQAVPDQVVRYEGYLTFPFALVGGFVGLAVSYTVLSSGLLLVVFWSSYFGGQSPASYPWLYKIGAISVFTGLQWALRIDGALRKPDGFLGY